MNRQKPSPINLSKLKEDVLSAAAAEALPHNLSDFWLNALGESLQEVLDDPDDESSKYLAGPLALVIHLLEGKSEGLPLEIAESTLLRYLADLQLEIALEEISRKTDISVTPATLETIFTDRSITLA